MTYEQKWAVLSSYAKLKGQFRLTLMERDELRDLTRMSDEIGIPPTKGNVSDPTGNTAVRLLNSLTEAEAELTQVQVKMNEVKRFIQNAEGISDYDKYILTMKFIRGYSHRKIQQVIEAPTKEAVRKQIYRIVDRLEPKEAGE